MTLTRRRLAAALLAGVAASLRLAGASPDAIEQLAAADVVARYTASRRTVVVTPISPAAPVRVTREGGRRFGVAIACVLLLILFTLAMSIVLKPRGHDMPPELSQRALAPESAAG